MFKFELLQNEKIVAVYRQTEAVLFKTLLIIFVLIYFPWYFLLKYELLANYSKILFVWTVLVLLYAGNKYLLWLLNVYLLTNKRLVLVKYKNLITKQVWEAPLNYILNVSFSVKGFWQHLFQFGAVEVWAKGLHEPLVLKNIAAPSKVKDFIWQTLEQNKTNKPLA